MDDYVPIASFTHHPYYQPFILEVADNWLWSSYQNVPIDELLEIANYAIDNGYSIAWGSDVSEKGFKWRNGYAILPVKKEVPDAEGTDMARWAQLSDKDREAELWDIKGPVKEQWVTPEENSWDTNQLYEGYFYCSEAFFRAKTLNILVHKDAIPAKIAKKMGIKK